jgi:hypothetical protein
MEPKDVKPPTAAPKATFRPRVIIAYPDPASIKAGYGGDVNDWRKSLPMCAAS